MNSSPESTVLRKVAWRLLPLLCLLYIFNIRNRTNIGYRREQLEVDLNITPADFDYAYGLFYFGYLLFQMPSNLLLRRIGARRALAGMMIVWGVISVATFAVTGLASLSLMRIALGIVQAGFFPGVILYLTFWFPNRERARATALFMMAIALSGVIGNSVAGIIVHELDGVASLHGWQWILLLEGIPTVVLGFLVLLLLSNSPAQANWLSQDERGWLLARLSEEEAAREKRQSGTFWTALVDVRVWILIGVYLTVAVGANASGAYLAKLIRKRFEGETELVIGQLIALVHLCAIVAMLVIGTHSDRTGERRLHVAFTAFLAAGGWMLAQHPDPWPALFGFCLAQMGMMAMLPVFWALPTGFLSGAAAAGGIALINSIGNLGGLFGPRILGEYGLQSMAIIMAAGGALVLLVRKD